MVFANQMTGKSKQFAFIDLNTREATEVIIKAWHQKAMERYLNQIECCHYEEAHQKLTIQERQESVKQRKITSGGGLCNLFVDRLPLSFDEKSIFDVFSLYGEVVSVKVKQPAFLSMPVPPSKLSAYVAYKTHPMALKAKQSLDGKCLTSGGEPIVVEFYSTQNKFTGLFKGLDREQLINNTHFRVLFMKGIDTKVSRCFSLIVDFDVCVDLQRPVAKHV